MKYVVGIDIGTTGAKCGIFDLKGTLIAQGYREYICEYPKPNWVEQDVEMVTAKAMEATLEAINCANIAKEKIVSVALSTQRTCSIFLDENEKALKMISWQDNRTGEEIKDICEKISEEEYYDITGLPMNTTWVLTKILWMRKNKPELWNKTKRVVQLQDYVLRQLGANDYYIDIPDAVLMGMWDNNELKWSERILDIFKVDRSLLPIATKCGTKIGAISKNAAMLSGILEGTPICVGAGDQNSAAIGAGIIEEGVASVSIGTGGMAIILLDKPYRDPDRKICVGRHAIYGKWQIEGYQIGAAGVFRWFRDEIAALEKENSKKSNTNIYDVLNEMISQVPPGAEGLVFLPFLASCAAPKWNSEARGTLVGLTFAHDRRHIARAVMEGITLEQKDILNSMKATGNNINRVRIMGGAAKSVLWCQMQANMYNMKVETLKVSDTALVGAAIFAAIGVNEYKTIEEAVQNMVWADKEYTPQSDIVDTYNKIYEIYTQTYNALDEYKIYNKISDFQNI